MVEVSIVSETDLAARWQALERRVGAPFFRSWVFLGCLAEQRFAGASLLAVTGEGQDVALGLLGHGGRLNESGDAAQDAIFIEHNGLLAAPGAQAAIPLALAAAAARAPLHLSGIDDATLAAARSAGWVDIHQSRWAPCAALHTLQRPFLDTLSANTRAQIRRSRRLYGPELTLTRAQTLAQAQAFLAEMVELHQDAWQARGQPGAFASPWMRTFHTALVARAWPLGQADLLRITAGPRLIGTLYNLIGQARVHSYQSGFAYSDDAREKPGLCCHAMAIEHYAASGARHYDFLGGADRYKLSLARDGQMLHWATLHRPWSPQGIAARARAALRRRLSRDETSAPAPRGTTAADPAPRDRPNPD